MKNISRRPAGRRLSALLAAGALATSAVSATMLPAQAVPVDPGTGYDAAPAQDAADWVAGRLQGGLLQSWSSNDYGLSIDAALALDTVGGHAETVRAIADAVAGGIDAYTTGVNWGTARYAGSTAKAAVLAQVATPGASGNAQLIADLEARTADAGELRGRIEDQPNPGDITVPAPTPDDPGHVDVVKPADDYANVIGQAYAARALATAGSPEAPAATSYLLEQQCDAGFFRLYFEPKKQGDQSCQAGTATESSPDTDVTAMAVIALKAMPATPEVTEAIDDAVAWLVQAQDADGSFGGGTATEAPNTNSTGLGGWALGAAGESEAAQSAASWLRRRQAADLAPCVSGLAGQTGALAYDLAAFRSGLAKGLGDQADQWQRATAQALPALLWAQPDSASTPVVSGPASYVRGGTATAVTVKVATAGRMVCASNGVTHVAAAVGDDGTAPVLVTPTERTGTQRWTITTTSGSAKVSMPVLGNKTLRPQLSRTTLARGKRLAVRVSGLARGEKVTVLLRGVKVASGRANDAGTFAGRFTVRGKRGPAQVRVQGQFADRAGTVRLKVA